MTSARHGDHTIAGNFQGIYLKHRNNVVQETLYPTVAVVDSLYVNCTAYPLSC